MAQASEEDKALLLRFKITQTLQIQLTRLKVYTYSSKGAKPHKCKLCKFSSKFKSSVKVHLKIHTGVKPYSCNLCNYKASQRWDLNKHIVTHTGEKPYNCSFCTKSFTRNSSKVCHEAICKGDPRRNDPSWVEMQKTFKCHMCPFSATRTSNLKRHLTTHTGEKPFSCTLCNEMFRSTAHLRSHIFTHTREKPHNCPFCKRGFALVANQKNHEKICKLNPKQGDVKWVEEQKKFKCQLCTFRTIEKRRLESHIRSHIGEKPYNCPLCLYRCATNSRLHSHLRWVHIKKNGLKCPECEFATLTTSKLLKHVKEFHIRLKY